MLLWSANEFVKGQWKSQHIWIISIPLFADAITKTNYISNKKCFLELKSEAITPQNVK